ncbi:MAG: hypothetical protein M1454_05795 [Candidatus Thermoplasmatota archaeon]|nr:hypothetical protein [Candidatus Thermoplasmatota archaeon]MCL5730820.1 hypothetical protein [Candidatus Thermoplasmatota archaeon]
MDSIGQGKHLKDSIIEAVASEERSISGIQKFLEDNGNRVHRLVLTGYLSALVDVGILKEKDLKPSRIFFYEIPPGQDIYRVVGLITRGMTDDGIGDICLEVLHFLFGRPIFFRELERCGSEIPKNYKQVHTDERLRYIETLQKRGIKIPVNNPLIEPTNPNQKNILEWFRRYLIDQFDLKKAVEETSDRKQKTLD